MPMMVALLLVAACTRDLPDEDTATVDCPSDDALRSLRASTGFPSDAVPAEGTATGTPEAVFELADASLGAELVYAVERSFGQSFSDAATSSPDVHV